MAKGQMFIIISIITVVALVLLRTGINLPEVLESKRYLELGLERLEFSNLRSEIRNAININSNQTNITDNVNAFIDLARQ